VLVRQVPENPVNRTALAALSAHTVPSKATGRHQEILGGALDDALVEPDFNSPLNPMVRPAGAALNACNNYQEADVALNALYPT
ncbi:DUF935 domain-containing protein, partial [Neisseria meningitidis]